MKKLLNFFNQNLLKIGISALLLFIPLYPKLPSVHITHTWVYIRLEDFLIFLVVCIWLLQLLLRKVKLPPKIWIPFGFYWLVAGLSLVFSLVFIGPHLANFFPSIAVFYYIRHIEYLILFFVAFSTIKSFKDLKTYLIVISVSIVAFSIYAFGQRFYLDLWSAFPKFFQQFPYCFPSFQTGNEEFAKGVALCLPKGARITSTFAGHYDLAAYLVLLIPILTAVTFSIKKKLNKILGFALTLASIMVLIFTASRISFIAYLIGVTATLIFVKQKKFIFPFYVLSVVLLLTFSGSTAKRFMETFRIASVVTNNQGQVVGQKELPDDLKNRVSDNILANVPTQNLPAGTGYLGLPQLTNPEETDKAIVQSSLSIEEAKRLKLENGGVEISTLSGTFLIKKVLVYDISFTTRFQAEWPNAWRALLRNPLLGSGFATITLAADNNFLRILGEIGLLGFTAFLSIFYVLYLVLRQVLSKVTDKISKGYLLGITGGVIGLFFNAVLIDVFEASKVAETMWILLGIAAGTAFLYKKDFEYKKYIISTLTSQFLTKFYLFFLFLVFYLKTLSNFFVADDFTWLKWAATTNLGDLPRLFINSEGFFYRPLDKVVMFFLYTGFSFSPAGYHIFMLSVHFLVGLGVYALVQKLFKSRVLSFIGAFSFLFLPALGENLFWISTISTTLSTFFIIYLLLSWIKFRETNSKKYYSLSFFLAVLAFMSYEVSIIIPLLIILTDIFINKIRLRQDKVIASYIPFVTIAGLYPFIRQLSNSVSFGGDYSYNFSNLIQNYFGNFIGYGGLFVIGEPFLQIYTNARTILRQESMYIGIVLFVVLLLSVWILYLKRHLIKGVLRHEDSWLFTFATLFGFISLIPFLGLGNISERYGYLAAIGFAVVVVLIFRRISRLFKKQNYQLAVLIILTTILGIFYYVQINDENRQWKEAGRITQRTLSYLRLYYDGRHPNSNFYFANLPIRKEQAWIFPVGLEDGIWFIYRDTSIRTYKLDSVEDGKKLRAGVDKTKNFFFGFNKEGNIYDIK
jgi:hypothetical protein